VADQWAADSWQLKQGEENAAAVSPFTSHIHSCFGSENSCCHLYTNLGLITSFSTLLL